MNNTLTPLHIEGLHDGLYGGFWLRLASILLDALLIIPVAFLVLYINSSGKDMFFFTFIPNLLFGLGFGIGLPKEYGGTPGKLIVGIKIIRMDGNDIGWREAILRYSINLVITLLSMMLMTTCILKADDVMYTSLSWLEQAKYLTSLSPISFMLINWASSIWIYSELAVLLTNKRKRALHDFIAGTVVVKTKYLPHIRREMQREENKNTVPPIPPNIPNFTP